VGGQACGPGRGGDSTRSAARGLWSSRRLTREYNARLSVYEKLEHEALFILRGACGKFGDRIYSVKSRVKSLDSITQKAQREEMVAPLELMHDIVGLRVVCLYRSDLGALRDTVSDSFQVLEIDDKAGGQSDPTVFDYESVHLKVTLPAACGGPRYEGLIDQPFEIQLRTLAMDSWATISHDLSYKKGWDIPMELQRDFHAIAALLHLADKHFDDVYKHVNKQREAAMTALSAGKPRLQTKVSPYSVAAYLRWKLPERKPVLDDSVGEFSQSLLSHGIRTLGALDRQVDSGMPAALELEQTILKGVGEPGKQFWFADLGLARRAVAAADPSFEADKTARATTMLRASAIESMPITLDVFTALVGSLQGEASGALKCEGNLDQTRAFLSAVRGVDVDAVVQWLEEFGGYCDCEVIYNVAPLVLGDGQNASG
jgi:putative GTP pyrophosphokinase